MNWLLTHSGIKFDLENPTVDMVNIFDIAHALARECRFGGHCKAMYSVAQHSLLMAVNHTFLRTGRLPTNEDVDLDLVREVLLHDAAEAYCKDIPRPLKTVLGQVYKDVEARIDAVIREKYDLPKECTQEVKDLDRVALATEVLILMPTGRHAGIINTNDQVFPKGIGAKVLSVTDAEEMFLDAFATSWTGKEADLIEKRREQQARLDCNKRKKNHRIISS